MKLVTIQLRTEDPNLLHELAAVVETRYRNVAESISCSIQDLDETPPVDPCCDHRARAAIHELCTAIEAWDERVLADEVPLVSSHVMFCRDLADLRRRLDDETVTTGDADFNETTP
jgi:hypothetical protein